MDKFYTEKELNQILLSKPLDEFYGVILQLVNQEIIFENDEDFEQIDLSDTVIDSSYDFIDKNKDDETSILFTINSIVTVIDNQIYDVINKTFLDSDFCHVIFYLNAAQVYSYQDFSSKILNEMEDGIEKEKFCCDFGDNSKIYQFLDNYFISCTNYNDITDEFLKNANSSYGYQKKLN